LRRSSFIAGLVALVMARAIAATFAATLVVTKLADTNDATCGSDCSLREALGAASSGDTITFGADARGTATLVLGALVVDKLLTIAGPGQTALTISGGDTQRILEILPAGNLTASGLTFAHGQGEYYAALGVEAAGVVLNSGSFAFIDCTFADNHADGRGPGTGVNDAAVGYSDGLGKTMSFTRCTFRDNTAGGAACLDIDQGTLTITDSEFIDNSASDGPACVLSNSVGPATIVGTRFSGNMARAGGAVFVSGSGGTTIRNSTIVENTSTSGFGAGIYVFGLGTATLSNVTLAQNVAATGSNLYVTGGGAAVLRNTIVANTANNCSGPGITSHGYNLDTGNTCGFAAAGDQNNVAAGLAPLAASGGPTRTMPLYLTSAALDAGNPAAPGSGGDACEAADQRGISRPRFAGCDIGAFESTGPETIGNSGFVTPGDKSNYSWPAQPGVTQYETRRSTTGTFLAPCVGITTTGTSWHDTEIPSPGEVFYYVNRPTLPQLGTWGWTTAGIERTTPCP